MNYTECITYPLIPRDTFLNAVNELTVAWRQRLNYCKAEICYCNYSEFFKCRPTLLRSFNKIAAVYIPIKDRLFVLDYYSPYTCKHIRMFRDDLHNYLVKAHQFNCYRVVSDKQGSKIEYEPFIPFT